MRYKVTNIPTTFPPPDDHLRRHISTHSPAIRDEEGGQSKVGRIRLRRQMSSYAKAYTSYRGSRSAQFAERGAGQLAVRVTSARATIRTQQVYVCTSVLEVQLPIGIKGESGSGLRSKTPHPSQFRFLLRQGLERGRGESFFPPSYVVVVIVVFVVVVVTVVVLRRGRTVSWPIPCTKVASSQTEVQRITRTTDYHQPPHLPVYHPHLDLSTSSGRRVAARDSRAGEEDWTKRKKQNKTSKAEAEEQKSVRPRAERVEAGLQRRK
ncbi:uncharacterized protein [Mycetomoellerius zeteki]|uniref:uncharacterized protein n=1 Tax=Mycetomoellerius zeteki TaxID=64791 RepID=UPI00084EC636|nr:PREDICTED: uncharacterized protein LOC108724576 [Trachymyrmex zeteki]